MKKINIKFILNRLVVLSSVLLFAGCEGFLDEKPKNFRPSNNSYKDEAGVKAGLLGVYRAYVDMYIHKYVPMIGELGTDESLASSNDPVLSQIYGYKLTGAETKVIPDWYRLHYACIFNCNVLIDRVAANFPEPNDNIKVMVAEAKVLRAWCYFRLLQTLGPVPLVLHEQNPVDYTVPRSPIKLVYQQIEKDFLDATSTVVMPLTKSKSEPLRLTHWAAKAMLGKFYLTVASTKEAGIVDYLMETLGKTGWGYSAIEKSTSELYAMAETVLKDIKDNSGISLAPDYRKLFINEYRNSFDENMWELQANDGQATANPNRGFFFLQYYGMPVGNTYNIIVNACARKMVMHSPVMTVRGTKVLNSGGSSGKSSFIGGYEEYIDPDAKQWVEVDLRKRWVCTGGRLCYSQEPIAGKANRILIPQYWRVLYTASTPGNGVFNPATNVGKLSGAAGTTLTQQENESFFLVNTFYRGVTKFRYFNPIYKVVSEFSENGNTYKVGDKINFEAQNNAEEIFDMPTTYSDINSLPMNFTVIRYADVLLMLAEASYKANGDQATELTVECMNMVRDRARAQKDKANYPPNFPEFTAQDIDMELILNERKLELCFENVRWFDLARTGKLLEKYNLIIPGESNTTHDLIDESIDANKKFYLYPLPNSQVMVSTNKEGFFQNYGY